MGVCTRVGEGLKKVFTVISVSLDAKEMNEKVVPATVMHAAQI